MSVVSWMGSIVVEVEIQVVVMKMVAIPVVVMKMVAIQVVLMKMVAIQTIAIQMVQFLIQRSYKRHSANLTHTPFNSFESFP